MTSICKPTWASVIMSFFCRFTGKCPRGSLISISLSRCQRVLFYTFPTISQVVNSHIINTEKIKASVSTSFTLSIILGLTVYHLVLSICTLLFTFGCYGCNRSTHGLYQSSMFVFIIYQAFGWLFKSLSLSHWFTGYYYCIFHIVLLSLLFISFNLYSVIHYNLFSSRLFI